MPGMMVAESAAQEQKDHHHHQRDSEQQFEFDIFDRSPDGGGAVADDPQSSLPAATLDLRKQP